MIIHYIKMAFRNMSRQRMYAAIMVGGFAIGIAACLLIGLLIRHETGYDRQYPDAGRIYRVVGEVEDIGKMHKSVSFPAPMAAAMERDFPEIERDGRLMPNVLFSGAGHNQVRRADRQDNTFEKGFCFADQGLLDILQFPMLYGNRNEALSRPNSMLITKRIADKYFPGENPVGRVMYLNDDASRPMTISGVMANPPSTSHLIYDFYLSLAGVSFWDGEQDQWTASNYRIYVKLKPGVSIAPFEKRVTRGILEKYVIPTMGQASKADVDRLLSSAHVIFQPVSDIHLYSYDIDDDSPNGDIRYVWMFAAIGIFILLIACINFLNLSTARAANRAKEVGLRKVIGSGRGSLVGQFLTESLVYTIMAFALGLLLASVLLPLVNHTYGKQLEMPWSAWWMFPLVIVSAMFIGLISGIYPSFYLSAFRPISVLKGKLSLGSKNSGLRGALVVFQFTSTILLLLGTLVIYRQMQFVLHSNVGFNKDQVLMIQGTNTLGNQFASFEQELKAQPAVASVSASDFLPIPSGKRNGNTFYREGKQSEEAGIPGQIWTVDDQYLSSMGLSLKAGRNFSPDLASDSQAIIINETMARLLGGDKPVGSHITNGWQHFTVIGVVRDFNFESMRREIEPLCLSLGKSDGTLLVRLKSGKIKEAMSAIGNTWKQFMPHQALRYAWMDESFAEIYTDVVHTSVAFAAFSMLAIIIACLGLFALAAYMARQRRKEISIRKVLGASVPGLFTLLTANFLKLVFIALLIALPAGWWLMNQWLQDFAYRATISWDVFVISGGSVMLIALATVASQALRAAWVNPAESLRNE